jgi:hypothetical protein
MPGHGTVGDLSGPQHGARHPGCFCKENAHRYFP